MDSDSHQKGGILRAQGRAEEAIAEHERALALDPSNIEAVGELGFDYHDLGEFDKSIEYLDKAIRASPNDPTLAYWYGTKAWDNFGLKKYDQAIELARGAVTTKPNDNAYSHVALVASLALTGHDAEAREALQRYLALPSPGRSSQSRHGRRTRSPMGGDPRFVEMSERSYDGCARPGCRSGEQ